MDVMSSLPLYISELKGYLKALELLSGFSFNFGVKFFDYKESAERFVQSYEHGLSISRVERIAFSELKREVFRFVLNGMLAPNKFKNEKALEFYKKELIERINEYYGLAATSESENEAFHPLISKPIMRLHLADEPENHNFIFLVSIGSYIVLTYFRKRSPPDPKRKLGF